jgi:hypothetical protein
MIAESTATSACDRELALQCILNGGRNPFMPILQLWAKEGIMSKVLFSVSTARIFMAAWVLCASCAVHSQTPKEPYPAMAPLAQYLMADRDAEIALARSAAPPAISNDAQILVLGLHGYESAVAGKNGFVCAVERSWMSSFDDAGFWNPKMRGALCFNPEAARSVLPLTYKRTELALAGASKTEMQARIKDAEDKKELPELEAGAMSYMMSKDSYLNDEAGHWHPHIMLYAPKASGADWGADLPNSPVYKIPQSPDAPEPFVTYVVRVFKWSNGELASEESHAH